MPDENSLGRRAWRDSVLVCAAALLALPCGAAGQGAPGPVLVATASARDYLFGAGGTLAQMIAEGRPVYVMVFANGEKDSAGLKPSESRLRNREESDEAARALGVREVLYLGHKQGELAQISSSELRNQIMTMVRFYKPEILFFPDWYMHYLNDDDIYRVGRMAEESPYGGGDYFVQEMTYIGYGGYSAREYYFYSPYRPYRPREGGEGRAELRGVDIGSVFDAKLRAILELETANQRYAAHTRERLRRVGQAPGLLRDLTENAVAALVRSYAEELAVAIGRRHGYRYAEEFNHLGRGSGVPAHILERSREVETNP